MKIITFSNGIIGKKLIKALFEKGFKINLNVWTGDEKELVTNDKFFEQFTSETVNWREYRNFIDDRNTIKFDWLLNLWNSKILNRVDLKTSKKTLNIHPGLIPYTKGCDCATWAIQNSYPAGITLMEMNEKIDDGDVYCTKELAHEFPISGNELNQMIKKETLSFFTKNISDIISGKIKPRKSKDLGNYFSRKDTLENSFLNISNNKKIINFLNWALSHQFPDNFPKIVLDGKSYELKLKIKEK